MCDCIIGLLHYNYDGYELVTLDGLKKRIAFNRYYNEVLVPIYASNRENLKTKVWQLSDYGDFRKSTNLTRFKHCPYCGNAIDWKEIRRLPDVERSADY